MLLSSGWFKIPSFHFPKITESKPFFSNNVNIDIAVLTYIGTIDQIKFSLGLSDTYDGTYTYEEVTVNETHSFTATGVWIKWRAIGLAGFISQIKVKIN